MNTSVRSILTALSTAAFIAAPLASHALTTSAFSPGDLIKASGATVYYFATDGHRYVFPNAKTYFTWYTDFSKVKEISDGQLATIPMGRTNVTYRPGRKMVKITTDPKVYVVDQGGILRWVTTSQLAETLYGLSWKNQIDDVADAFFSNYKIGTPIQTASDYQPGNVMTGTTEISEDKQMDKTQAAIAIGSVANGLVPSSITVKAGTTVTWTNNDSMAHTVTGAGWSSDQLSYGQSFSHKFSSAGSFDYHCSIHPVMQGTVNVVN